jgi:RNA methyltransferase, TrmH family
LTQAHQKSTHIDHRHHPSIRRIRALQTRAARERTGLFFLEGIRFLAEATHHQVPLETLIVAPKLLTRPFGQKLVRLQQRRGVPCLEVSRTSS